MLQVGIYIFLHFHWMLVVAVFGTYPLVHSEHFLSYMYQGYDSQPGKTFAWEDVQNIDACNTGK